MSFPHLGEFVSADVDGIFYGDFKEDFKWFRKTLFAKVISVIVKI